MKSIALWFREEAVELGWNPGSPLTLYLARGSSQSMSVGFSFLTCKTGEGGFAQC